eukprot:superscaffoldBa00001096_g8945
MGGAVVEIFSGQGKDPVAKWKLCGGPSAIHKWSTLCIDLVSFTGELFKDARFLTLDGITLFATCKVRRIFTMKTEPTGVSDDDMFLNGAALMDLIPRSCQFPADVNHVTQVLNMENLQKADMRSGHVNSDCGTPGSLQPHPPKERVFGKQGSKKLRVYSAGRERLASPVPSDAASGDHSKRSKTREKLTPGRQESRQQPLTLTGKTEHLTAGLSSDLQVWSSWESNEGSEPQFTLPEEVFTFSSQPHSPKRGQGQGDQEKMEMGDDQFQSKSGRRYEAQPEDDFIGSESDEDKSYTTFQHQRPSVDSNPATPTSPDLTLDMQLEVQPEYHNMDQTSPKALSPGTTDMNNQPPSSRRAGPTGMVPTRCLSPSGSRQDHKCGPCGPGVVSQVLDGSSVSLSRRLLQEVKLDDSRQCKEKEDKHVDSSACDLHLVSSLQMHGDDDDEELRMLASLKREQEEDECRASGFSASKIHQCNVSISMSSDDASTWTHISMVCTIILGYT